MQGDVSPADLAWTAHIPIDKDEGSYIFLWKGPGCGTAVYIPGGHCLLLCSDVVHSGGVPDDVMMGRKYIRLHFYLLTKCQKPQALGETIYRTGSDGMYYFKDHLHIVQLPAIMDASDHTSNNVTNAASSTSDIDNHVSINNIVVKQHDSVLPTSGVIDAVTLQQEQKLLFDVDQINPSMLYINETDKLLLQSLPKLENEIFFDSCVENLKKVEEMKIALAAAHRHNEENKLTDSNNESDSLFATSKPDVEFYSETKSKGSTSLICSPSSMPATNICTSATFMPVAALNEEKIKVYTI